MVLLLEITKLKITQKPTRNVHYAHIIGILSNMRIGTKVKGFRGYNLPQLIANNDISLFPRFGKHEIEMEL